MIKRWTDAAWSDYVWWQGQDRKTLKRINQLVEAIERDPFEGMGKPEPLRGVLAGTWSRRIDAKNRIIYSVEGEEVTFYSVKNHYGDR